LPKVFKQLLVLRSHLVKPHGIAGVYYGDLARSIDTGRNYAVGDKIGRWTLFAKHQDELITGAMTGTSNFGCQSIELPGHGLCSRRP